MADNEGIFDVITDVLEKRQQRTGRYSVKDKVYDIFKIADNKQPGAELASRDVMVILHRVGETHSLSTVSRSISELTLTEGLVYTGKKFREGTITNHRIPHFRLANKETNDA